MYFYKIKFFVFTFLFFIFSFLFLSVIIMLFLFSLNFFNSTFLFLSYLCLVVYIIYFHVKNGSILFSAIVKIYKNKESGNLEILNIKGQIKKTIDFGELKYIHLEYVSYAGGKAPFASVVLIGDKFTMPIKKFAFKSSKIEAFEAAYQWSLPIAEFLKISIKKESEH